MITVGLPVYNQTEILPISIKRGGMIKKHKPPFFKVNKKIDDIINLKRIWK